VCKKCKEKFMTIPFFLLNYLSILIFGFHLLFSLYVSLCLSVCLSVYLSVSLSICLSVCLFICLYVSLALSLSVCLSLSHSLSLFSFQFYWPLHFPSLFSSFISVLIFSLYVSLSFFLSILGNKIHKRNKNKHSPGCARNKIFTAEHSLQSNFYKVWMGVSKNYLHGGRDSQNLLKKNPMLYLAVLRGHSNNTWHSRVGDRHSATCTFYYNCI